MHDKLIACVKVEYRQNGCEERHQGTKQTSNVRDKIKRAIHASQVNLFGQVHLEGHRILHVVCVGQSSHWQLQILETTVEVSEQPSHVEVVVVKLKLCPLHLKHVVVSVL